MNRCIPDENDSLCLTCEKIFFSPLFSILHIVIFASILFCLQTWLLCIMIVERKLTAMSRNNEIATQSSINNDDDDNGTIGETPFEIDKVSSNGFVYE